MGVRPALLEGWLQQKYPGLSLQHQRRTACSLSSDMPPGTESNFTGSSRPKSRLDPRYAYRSGSDHEFMGARASIQSCRSAGGICACKWHDA